MKKQYTLDEDGFTVETIGSKYGPNKPRKGRLTVGCRARILKLKEKPKRKGPEYTSNEDYWRKIYGGHEVLLKTRSSSGFDVMVLGKGVKKLKKEAPNTVINEVAWVSEEDMELVDKDFDINLDFMDWYQDHEEDFCPDCLAWYPDRYKPNAVCPNEKCPSNHLEDYEDD